MNPTKITQIGKMKVNAIESAMNEISGIELADHVLHICCLASAGKCSQISLRCTTYYVPQKVRNADRNFEDTQAIGWQLLSYSRSSV